MSWVPLKGKFIMPTFFSQALLTLATIRRPSECLHKERGINWNAWNSSRVDASRLPSPFIHIYVSLNESTCLYPTIPPFPTPTKRLVSLFPLHSMEPNAISLNPLSSLRYVPVHSRRKLSSTEDGASSCLITRLSRIHWLSLSPSPQSNEPQPTNTHKPSCF